MRRQTKSLLILALTLALSACDEGSKDAPAPSPDAGGEPDVVVPPPTSSCVTEVEPNPSGGITMVELCALENGVRHVVVEGARVPRQHASYQVFLGLDAPVGSQDELPEGAFKLMSYGGGTPAPAPSITAYLGAASASFPEVDASFVNADSTYCFDIHDGSETAPAYFVLWLEGVNGADCADRATLTMDAAIARKLDWIGAVDKSKKSYFYQAAGVEAAPLVTLFDEPVLTVEEITAWLPDVCTTTIAPNEDGFTSAELCEVAGAVRHVVVEDVIAPGGHTAIQVWIGVDEAPMPGASVEAGVFRAQAYGGALPPPYEVSPDFGVQVGEASAALSALDPSFVRAISTFCFDVHDGAESTPAYFVMWIHGENGADCFDRTTLTLETAVDRDLENLPAIDKSKKSAFYLSKPIETTPVVTLRNTPAVETSDILAALAP